MPVQYDADIIVAGAGLAGLVAATEAADAGKRVLLLDQEGEQNLGGQAFWSLGGLFFIDSPEQRRLGIRDSHALATRDWMTTAGFDRSEDHWPRQWAAAYLEFAAGEKRSWLHAQGMRWFPIVGWAERGGGGAGGSGNSVPRFHLTWGTGPGVLAPFERRLRVHIANGRITALYRHRITGLQVTNGIVHGVVGEVLEPTVVERGQESSRVIANAFSLHAQAVVITSGGIGGNHDLVRRFWPVDRLGTPPAFMVSGVPRHVDGALQQVVAQAGAQLINPDRMWHYTEGLRNWNPIWPNHGIRILPGPSSLWLAPNGERLPFPNVPGVDSLGTLQHITTHGYPYTWFLLNRAIIKREFALSGSEQNPDLTGKDIGLVLKRLGKGVQAPVQAFMEHGEDFVVRDTLPALVEAMNAMPGVLPVDGAIVEREVRDRDAQLTQQGGKDPQLALIHNARRYFSERVMRIASPAPLLAARNGPLIAVKLNILTRKSLGGLATDLHARVLGAGDTPMPGLYAAGEVAGFGGGGVHGYRALEGTFLGGCLFSGRTAGRAAARDC
ncbi:FAD-binding dehydrogenase [Gemmatimonas phototrophica]|uniref:FAD-binding dehydrogenase n=1 Tax=Gemmatimonas phototrophica TaxID=1379270 RepID=A0A143BJD5_9BACT|nr:FAD-binding dehydrogenase [Gemmatimonas phototrophica]AMW05177.1 FAD-binding dehydrogenase [Gemmatimonas phototrophica]